MTRDTIICFAVAALVFMNLQAVVFGFGMMAALYYPNHSGDSGFFWIPAVVAVSSAISAALSWWIAPHLRARFWRSQG